MSYFRLVGENTRLRLSKDVLEFPSVKSGESVTIKTDMKNSNLEEVQVIACIIKMTNLSVVNVKYKINPGKCI